MVEQESAPPRGVRMPGRITAKADSGGRKEPFIEQPLPQVLQDELVALAVKYWEADLLERTEDQVQEIVDEFCIKGANTERLFTQALYTGLIVTIAHLRAEQRAVAEFQMLRRREIEARLDALEQRPAMKYCGVFDKSQKYFEGNFVTESGSIWHANCETTGVVPGEGSPVWTLAAKRGRDGRDRNRESAR
jgi:hypothetical protein